MKYFIDFEFLEGDIPCRIKGFNIPKWLVKPNNTIQPISVGICSSDGREYYAISKDFNLKEAWNRYDEIRDGFRDCGMTPNFKKVYWIRDNVLKPIFKELVAKEHAYANQALYRAGVYISMKDLKFNYRTMKRLIKKFGKTNKQIAEEIYEFCSNDYHKGNNLTFSQRKEYPLYDKFKPEFYGYYADYDWVVFCWLFGRMIDLPKGFPMYCFDLKQSIDGIVNKMNSNWFEVEQENIFGIDNYKRIENPSFEDKLNLIKQFKDYPKETNKHNALADSKFARDLYYFLKSL